MTFSRSALLLLFLVGCTTGGPRPLPMEGFDGDVEFDAGPVDAPDAGPLECSAGSTVGDDCASDPQCSDGCFCNGIEACSDEGVCVAGTPVVCDDEIDCTMDACDEMADRCTQVAMDELCQDDDACNGLEVCDTSLGCRTTSPLYCNDENSCTVDSCDTEMGCLYNPRDLDGDGFTDGRCGGDDCDDDPRFGTMIYPGAPEDCMNRRDDNCDGFRDFNDPTCLPMNGTCAAAQPLDGPGTYSGSTRGLTDDVDLSCKTSGPDAFFTFTLPETMDVRVTVSGASGTAVSIRRAAVCAAGPDIGCNDFSPPTLLRRSMAAGDYVIVVKQSSGSTFDLTLNFEPPTVIPPVDTCGAGTVDVSAGGTFEGMFGEVEDDYRLNCNGNSRRDAAYTFTIDEPKDVVLRASSTAPSFNTTYISLVTDCDDSDSTIACRSSSGTAEVSVRDLPPGTYWVLIEDSHASAGTWLLDVSIMDPAPRSPGDTCSSVIDITSSTGTAAWSTAALDVGASCGTSFSPRDVIFTFTLDTPRDVELTTTSSSSHWTALHEECGRPSTERRCRNGGTTLTQNFRSLEAGTYFVIVHSSSSSGNATARIVTSPPTPIPPNDRCSGAIPIVGSRVATDTLVDFEDDLNMGCGGSNPDAFYEITVATRTGITATVEPVAGFTHSHNLSLRSSCTSVALECHTGRPAVIDTVLDPGTYYLVVEASPFSASDYNIRVFTYIP